MLRRAEYWAWRLGGRLSLPLLSVPLAPLGKGEDRRLVMWVAPPVPKCVWAKAACVCVSYISQEVGTWGRCERPDECGDGGAHNLLTD